MRAGPAGIGCCVFGLLETPESSAHSLRTLVLEATRMALAARKFVSSMQSNLTDTPDNCGFEPRQDAAQLSFFARYLSTRQQMPNKGLLKLTLSRAVGRNNGRFQ